MSFYDQNFISIEFGTASQGYLRATSAELRLIKAALPRAETARERAIAAAIDYGIANPAEWDARLRRMQ